MDIISIKYVIIPLPESIPGVPIEDTVKLTENVLNPRVRDISRGELVQ
jgi:hypothetical protein